MATTKKTAKKAPAKKAAQPVAKQEYLLESGNELAAYAAAQINYHVMGYFPITPSTQIAEYLDFMYAKGKHQVKMVPGDGEHGAAGICYGATVGGGRVFNATSANGLLYAIEQLPVQSGTRFPMVLNVVNRTVSGPLDIKCDHSDIMMALNTGWIILMAHTPQMVYDMNIIAVKVGEHEDVRLPVIVSSDGFFTSHQKKKVHVFEDGKTVQDFVGPFKPGHNIGDGTQSLTFGAYMNEDELTASKLQLNEALEKSRKVIKEVFAEYAELSGRKYAPIETYKIADADTVLLVSGSAYETAVEAVDRYRKNNPKAKVGAMALTQIRPFPIKETQKALEGKKVVLVADRQDSYSGLGGNMSTEIRAALQAAGNGKTKVLSRVFGLGGTEYPITTAYEMIEEALKAKNPNVPVKNFDYQEKYYVGDTRLVQKPFFGNLTIEEQQSGITVEEIEKEFTFNLGGEEIKRTRRVLDVKGANLRALTGKTKRIAQGHGACNGCGIFSAVNTFLKGIDGPVVMLWHTGCGMVVTTGYPYTSFKSTYVHNLFQNGAATVSGMVEAYHERKRRGELSGPEDPTFIMVTGDGGHDIGMGPSIGAANRNHKMIILEYDNEGYMNTGNQLSFSTPMGNATSTSNVGPAEQGKTFLHKDVVQIFAGTHIPYIFTGVESEPLDLIRKAAKAQWYARNKGTVFGKLLIACTLNWKIKDSMGTHVIAKAVDTCFFPLYEIERGITTLTYNPEEKGKKVPVGDWFGMMGKSKHLLKNDAILKESQDEVDRRWTRLKAMSAHPDL